MVKVSIIVPVYNVEKFLFRCVDSLINQTYKNIEVILVDDGSPDQCPMMCDQLAELDNRIKVIHKTNGGLSSARNAGLQVATGEYVGFVDSDDVVACNMYEKMVDIAQQYNVDMVMSDYQRVFADGATALVSKQIDGGLYTKDEIVKNIFSSLIMAETVDYGPLLSVCQCLYNREFLQKYSITFANDVKWSEDNLFSSCVGYHATRFYYLKNEALYHYYENSNTITTSYRPGAWDVYCRMNKYLQEYFLPKTDYDFSRQIQLHILYYACNVLGMECKNASSLTDAVKAARLILHTPIFVEAMKGFQLPIVGIKLKIQLFMMKEKLVWPLVLLMRR